MNSKNRQTSHSIDFVFVILTFFVYALCMLALVYMGAMVYQSVNSARNRHDTVRTAAAYLNEKVRQNDVSGEISVSSIGDSPALMITKDYNGTAYATYIYGYEGNLCELFTRAENEADPKTGTKILELGDITFEQEKNGLIDVSLTDSEGTEHGFMLYFKSSGGED